MPEPSMDVSESCCNMPGLDTLHLDFQIETIEGSDIYTTFLNTFSVVISLTC